MPMEFCPQCKSMMMPKDGMMVCRKCGHKMPKAAGESMVSKTKQLDRVVPVLEQESAGLPTTNARCPSAAIISPTGGCASCVLLMRARFASSVAPNAAEPGESMTKHQLY